MHIVLDAIQLTVPDERWPVYQHRCTGSGRRNCDPNRAVELLKATWRKVDCAQLSLELVMLDFLSLDNNMVGTCAPAIGSVRYKSCRARRAIPSQSAGSSQ
jgi:hypothetical protein